MPLYDRECNQCGHAHEEFDTMSNVGEHNRFVDCPKCGGVKQFERIITGFHNGNKAFHKPIEMQSVAATNWDQLYELKRKCPDIQMSMDPNHPDFGVPMARNRMEKKKILAATGYVESN